MNLELFFFSKGRRFSVQPATPTHPPLDNTRPPASYPPLNPHHPPNKRAEKWKSLARAVLGNVEEKMEEPNPSNPSDQTNVSDPSNISDPSNLINPSLTSMESPAFRGQILVYFYSWLCFLLSLILRFFSSLFHMFD